MKFISFIVFTSLALPGVWAMYFTSTEASVGREKEAVQDPATFKDTSSPPRGLWMAPSVLGAGNDRQSDLLLRKSPLYDEFLAVAAKMAVLNSCRAFGLGLESSVEDVHIPRQLLELSRDLASGLGFPFTTADPGAAAFSKTPYGSGIWTAGPAAKSSPKYHPTTASTVTDDPRGGMGGRPEGEESGTAHETSEKAMTGGLESFASSTPKMPYFWTGLPTAKPFPVYHSTTPSTDTDEPRGGMTDRPEGKEPSEEAEAMTNGDESVESTTWMRSPKEHDAVYTTWSSWKASTNADWFNNRWTYPSSWEKTDYHGWMEHSSTTEAPKPMMHWGNGDRNRDRGGARSVTRFPGPLPMRGNSRSRDDSSMFLGAWGEGLGDDAMSSTFGNLPLGLGRLRRSADPAAADPAIASQ